MEQDTKRQSQNVEIEKIKSQLTEREKVLDRSLAILPLTLSASHQKTLEAVEILWKEVLRIRKLSDGSFLVYQVFTQDEVESEKGRDRLREVAAVIDENQLTKELINASIEELRPFMGERLWLLFSIYPILDG